MITDKVIKHHNICSLISVPIKWYVQLNWRAMVCRFSSSHQARILRPINGHVTFAAENHLSDLSINHESTKVTKIQILALRDLVRCVQAIQITTIGMSITLESSTLEQVDQHNIFRTAVPHSGTPSINFDIGAIMDIGLCHISMRCPSTSEV